MLFIYNYSQKHVTLTAPPNAIQGYGRIALKNVLPLNNVYTSYDLYVGDLAVMKENQAIVYLVNVQTGGFPLK